MKKPRPSGVDTHRRRLLATAASTAVTITCGAGLNPAHAQASYPDKPVKIVVPSSPGGSLDAVARIVAQHLTELWQKTVYVEDKAGGNLIIGTTYAAKSAPDGYTLLFAHDGAVAINPVIYRKLSYEQKDLIPIAQIAFLPMVLYANVDLPAKNFDQLLRMFKDEPGKLSLAIGGTSSQMTSELFKTLAQVNYVNVPYKGAGPGLVALAAGEVQLSFADTGSAASIMQSGKVRPIAVASPQRLKQMRDVPRIAEAVPGYSVASWSGLFAPVGTPAAIVSRIAADVRTVMATPQMQSRLETLGVVPFTSTPRKFADLIASDTANWQKLVKERNLYMND